MFFFFWSPTAQDWLEKIAAHRPQLLNPKPQMEVLLEAVREDVEGQFDENQGSWQSLAKYTITKKIQNQKDLRILHETKEGEGLRLREAYRKAGRVNEEGVLIFSYPEEKPYAKEHQEGRIDRSKPAKRGKLSRHVARHLAEMDKEYRRKMDDDRY